MEYILSIITGIIGVYVGHKLTVNYDKRKEFNLLAEPIIDYLEEVVESLNDHYNCGINRNKLTHNMDQPKKIMRRLGFIRKPIFIKRMNEFNEVIDYIIHNKAPLIGQKENEYKDRYQEAIIKTKNLIKFLKLK